jgi:hypothetical protein
MIFAISSVLLRCESGNGRRGSVEVIDPDHPPPDRTAFRDHMYFGEGVESDRLQVTRCALRQRSRHHI